MTSFEQRTIGKITRRLLPLCLLAYVTAYLDRVNVAFAAPELMRDLGLSATMFGTGAGIFFIGYVLFEIPSNLALAKFGSRQWVARIMLTWGLLSAATAFVRGELSFNIVRFLLGVAEAGFFPGIIFYLGLWFPAHYKARIVSWFLLAIPLSIIFGAPISGLILTIGDFGGLKAWQWLFTIEAVPAFILAFLIWRTLCDRPADADWLDPSERRWVEQQLAVESGSDMSHHVRSATTALFDWRVLLLGLAYFGILVPNYGIAFFLPQIIAASGRLNPFEIGLVNSVPYLIGTASMLVWARDSDKRRERKSHIAFPIMLMSCGFVAAALTNTLAIQIVAISFAALGFAITPVFWTVPGIFWRGSAAAAAIAAINSIGNLGGYFGPQIFGILIDRTGGSTGALLFLAAAGLIALVLILRLGRRQGFEVAV